MNKRFRDEVAGLQSEALATHITIDWDPLTDDADITFHSTRYLQSGDQYITQMDTGDGSIVMNMEEVLARAYEIGGKEVSGMDVNAFIRMIYDEVYNERNSSEPEE